MQDIEDYRLGETDKVLQLENRAENILVANHMANRMSKKPEYH